MDVSEFEKVDTRVNSTIHTLVEAHRSAWADAIRTDDNNAYVKAEAIALAMARVPASTPKSYRAKAEVAARFLRDTTALGFIASIFHRVRRRRVGACCQLS